MAREGEGEAAVHFHRLTGRVPPISGVPRMQRNLVALPALAGPRAPGANVR